MKNKIKLLLYCIPLYPINLIGEWHYGATTSLGTKKFKFMKITKQYWTEVYYYLKSKNS